MIMMLFQPQILTSKIFKRTNQITDISTMPGRNLMQQQQLSSLASGSVTEGSAPKMRSRGIINLYACSLRTFHRNIK